MKIDSKFFKRAYLYLTSRSCFAVAIYHRNHLLKDPPSLQLRRLGGVYGGWWVPTSMMNSKSVVYCAGVGEDTTFDEEMIQRFGCEIFAFDPTPRAIEYVAERQKAGTIDKRFNFRPFGLWREEAVIEFFNTPLDDGSDPVMTVVPKKTGKSIKAKCYSLTDLMKQLGHTHIDLLKMDIECAEHAVLESIINGTVSPKVVCVDYDQPCWPTKLHGSVKAMQAAGYTLVHIECQDYTYVRL
jgi:FkbM family methyltransferase